MGQNHDGQRGGFTLIELSIVLVIIGLIVGGVLVGQDLIHAATLRSVITDEQRYITAANTFREKYGGLPGDITNATNFFGTDPVGCPNLCGADCYTSPQTATCNGNGNGFIENDGEGAIAPQLYENFRAWQQLADAGLIQGSYTGTPGTHRDIDNEPGLNVPATKLANGGFAWTVFNAGNFYGPFPYAQLSTQYLLLGASYQQGDLYSALLTPTDAYAIDLKMDDGLPASGNVLGSNSWDVNGSCLATATGPYNGSISVPYCTLLFAVKSW